MSPPARPPVPQLLSPLTELRSLVLAGNAADWPYMRVDWRWLGGMARLRALHLRDALPGLDELALPPSLTELRVDRWAGRGGAGRR